MNTVNAAGYLVGALLVSMSCSAAPWSLRPALAAAAASRQKPLAVSTTH